jgi:hypothetical protein
VFPTSVVDEDRHRRETVERGGWSAVIVEPQPSGESLTTLVVGAVQPPIGPLIEQGLVEPLDLAVGLGSVAARPPKPDPQASGRLGEDHRLGVGLGVVGQDPLDGHAVLGEEPSCLDQEPGAGEAGLVGRSWLKATRERSSTAE